MSIILRVLIIGIMTLAFGVTSLSLAEEKQMLKPKTNLPKMNPVKKMCPDPAVVGLSAQKVSRTSPGKGRVRLIGEVKNIGSAPYETGPNQQTMYLFLLFNDGKSQQLATKPFQNLAIGGQLSLVHELDWSAKHDDVVFPTEFKLVIEYEPDIAADGNMKNDDCNGNNNKKTLPVANVDSLVK